MTESQQIQQEFSANFGRISERAEGDKESLRNNADYSDEERLDLVHESYQRADEEYAQAVEMRNAKFAERDAEIREDLFGAPSGGAGPAFTNALIQAHGADDGELSQLADLAAKTSDKTLGKAVFAVAHERGLVDIALPYLNSNPEALALYRELAEMPTPEERERAANFRFPRPSLESIKATPQTVAAANRAEQLRRMEYTRRAAGSR